jgi:hypothetical protein
MQVNELPEPRDEPLEACPTCGVSAIAHPSSRCLDYWVHTVFLGRELGPEDQPLPYSIAPAHPSLADLIDARRWPESFAVVQTSLGCTVDRKTARSRDYEHYEIVSAAEHLPLAVCRAAARTSPSGSSPLTIK